MKRGKRIASVLLTATLLSVLALTPMETKAGSSEFVLDAESLSTSDWNNPEGDVVVEDGKLIFSKESSDYTRFIAKTPIKAEERSNLLVKLSANVNFNQLPQGKSFILAFGMSSIESTSGEVGNIEVTFTNNGEIKAGITIYGEDGTPEVIVAPKSSGIAMNRTATVKVEITTDKNIQVSVNNKTVCAGTLPISGEGRFGFLQTGECGVTISDITVTHYQYETPQNTNVLEDFEKGEIDTSKLTAKMLWSAVSYPMGQVVQDYEGNQVLMHVNTGCAYIGTVYMYSNFEMTFDVPYLKLTKDYKEDGRLESAGFDKLIVSIGGERAEWDGGQWSMSAEAFTLENGTIYSNSNKETCSANLAKNPFEKGKPFSMQVKMVDSIMTIGMKWLEEESFQTVLQYKLKGGTPNGYIHIWAPQAANFAIDNLKITNLDEGADLIETEYVGGKIKVPEGNAPEKMERVYAEKKNEGLKWYWLIPVTAGTGISALMITALLTRSKKKESEATKNEQQI